MHKQFRKAYRIRQEADDYNAWLNGMYVCHAIASCFGGKKSSNKYPKEPYSATERKDREARREKRRREIEIADQKFNAYMTAWMSQVNKSMKNKENAIKATEGGETDGG